MCNFSHVPENNVSTFDIPFDIGTNLKIPNLEPPKPRFILQN